MLLVLLAACFPRVDSPGDTPTSGSPDDSDAEDVATETDCADDADEDDDGDVDCDDPDCEDAAPCAPEDDSDPPASETDCDDGDDDDDDGDVDCADDDCAGEASCEEEVCWDADAEGLLGADIASGTASGDDGAGSCGGEGESDTILRWVAPDDGVYVFDTVGSTADTTLWAIGGGCDGQELTCDDATFGDAAQLAIELDQGDVLLLGVEAEGPWTLSAWAGECPVVSLGSEDGVQGSTEGYDATFTSDICTVDVEAAITLRWMAPAGGTWSFSTAGSDFDTVIAVFDDDCSGDELGCNDDADEDDVGPSEVSVQLDAGQVVAIALGGYEGATGDFLLNITRE